MTSKTRRANSSAHAAPRKRQNTDNSEDEEEGVSQIGRTGYRVVQRPVQMKILTPILNLKLNLTLKLKLLLF